MSIVFKPDMPAIDKFLNSQAGPVGRWLAKQGFKVLARAKRQVGVRTGALRASLHMRHYRDSRGQYVRIGSSLSYARLHHQGSKPHLITPKEKQVLRFYSRGRIVYARAVLHPGNKPNRYLTDNLRLYT